MVHQFVCLLSPIQCGIALGRGRRDELLADLVSPLLATQCEVDAAQLLNMTRSCVDEAAASRRMIQELQEALRLRLHLANRNSTNILNYSVAILKKS